MGNVLRIFNDSVGVVSYAHNFPCAAPILTRTCPCLQELTERTGKNPQYQYVQVGCSKNAENAMLHFAQQQVGKPFSSSGMARSLLWPRESDGSSWYAIRFERPTCTCRSPYQPQSSTAPSQVLCRIGLSVLAARWFDESRLQDGRSYPVLTV